jgi:hypothetical protein
MPWVVGRACIRESLASIGARPGVDGCFSTAQITAALFGDLHSERVRLVREHRKKIALHNAVVMGTVLDRGMMEAGLSAIANAMTSRIRSSNLDRRSQDDLLHELAGTGTVLEDVVKEQSALRRVRHHDGDGEDEIDDADEDEADSETPSPKATRRHFRTKPGFVKAP